MNDLKLGTIPEDTAQRDAIHIAVAPVVAGEKLLPGQHVGQVADGKFGVCENPIGIVDPFLMSPVEAGKRFYLCLYQNTVTGMRHHWSHPSFGAYDPMEESRRWLEAYAAKLKPYDVENGNAFDLLIRELKSGELFGHGSDLHGLYELDDAEELRFHASRYLGIPIEWGKFTFSCSC